jgi:hypothetical protein
MNANSVQVLRPYKYEGLWVFDDASVGLHHEPFVSGADEMIDRLVANIPKAQKGFRLIFSPQPFPDYMAKLVWRRAENDGNWYFSAVLGLEGWLCPAMYKYFETAPKEIYAKAEPLGKAR